MRFPAPLYYLLAVVSSAVAHIERQIIPNCAAPCLTNANAGACVPSDDACLCKDPAFIKSATACIKSSCSGSDLQHAEAFAQQLCLALGVTLTASSMTATPTTSFISSGTQITGSISVVAGFLTTLAVAAVL